MTCPPRAHFDLFFGITRPSGVATDDKRDRGLQPEKLEEPAHGSLGICEEGVSLPPLLAGRLGTCVGEPFQIDTASIAQKDDSFGEIRAFGREHGRLPHEDGTVDIETGLRIELDDHKISYVNSQECAYPLASTTDRDQSGWRKSTFSAPIFCCSILTGLVDLVIP